MPFHLIASSESYYVILIFLSIMRFCSEHWQLKDKEWKNFINKQSLSDYCLLDFREGGKEMHTQEKWHSFFHNLIFFWMRKYITFYSMGQNKWLLGTILNSTYLEILYNHRKFCDHILWKMRVVPTLPAKTLLHLFGNSQLALRFFG